MRDTSETRIVLVVVLTDWPEIDGLATLDGVCKQQHGRCGWSGSIGSEFASDVGEARAIGEVRSLKQLMLPVKHQICTSRD